MEDNDNADSPLLGYKEIEEQEDIDKQIKQSIRESFIAKVFGILTYQMVILFIVVFIGFASATLHKWLLTSYFMFYFCFFIALTCVLIPFFDYSLYRKVPHNYIILTVFTLSYSWDISAYTVRFTPSSVLFALGLTTAMVLTLSIYAIFTKKDFTVFGGTLSVVLIIFVISCFVLPFISMRLYYLVWLYVGLILFCIYLIYDIQIIIGNNRLKLSEDDYILAAINLYLDVINIFVRILAIVGNRN